LSYPLKSHLDSSQSKRGRIHVHTITIHPGGYRRDRSCCRIERSRTAIQVVGAAASVDVGASIKEAILKATGAQSEIIELSATEKVFTVKVVNGKFADGTTAGRESEAGTIEAIVATAIAGKAQFKAIIVIIVQYLKRRNGSSRVVDSIEFRKDVIGAFRHHVS
jgi:hypothetical protein